MKQKIITTIVLLIVLVGIILGLRAFRSDVFVGPSKIVSKSKGNPEAAFKVVEYTDFLCPACRFGADILDQYLAQFPDEIYLEYRYFPLRMHPNAKQCAVFAECASIQGKFWEFHDLIHSRQKEIHLSKTPELILMEFADQIKVNRDKFDECLLTQEVEGVIKKHIEEGKLMGVRATPTYFINDEMIVGGNKMKESLEKRFGVLMEEEQK
jgi:protein-disulfide isomerase